MKNIKFYAYSIQYCDIDHEKAKGLVAALNFQEAIEKIEQYYGEIEVIFLLREFKSEDILDFSCLFNNLKSPVSEFFNITP